ncbi:MAG TPA: ComEC/Rec2 family competence protein, partial [Chitinophagaceae bacterium]|nr:ComEC/Rec2 family competence protein [Chitinophagaceae bacterium]
NPAAFNYKRYCAFQQIFQQAYLRRTDWILSGKRQVSLYDKTKHTTQQYILNTIDQYISGLNEVSIAKALLIGYKVDLDKDLVQQYSNAGVIHIIVIAGLHLGLIYALLLWILNRIPGIKNSKYARLVIVLFCLWCFALLTGASPPVLRAVIMFSSIAVGKAISRNSSVYNSLAASAFILLCIDPFSLWDVGFQLSYLAVTGIVVLHKYIYHWFYISNMILREAWNIASVSLAAQVFTLPACLYYFHQIPLLFMVTNIIAVPLATITLYGCVALVCLSGISIAAAWLGSLLTGCIWLLNHTVFAINDIPFSTWNDFSISLFDTLLLYGVILSALYWLIQRNRQAFRIFISGTFLLTLLSFSKRINSFRQKKIIVYDVPNHTAIDFIDGNKFYFKGDSDLKKDGLLQNFHLKPSRISFHSNNQDNKKFPIFKQGYFCQFYNKRILFIDTETAYHSPGGKINVDYIIISKNPRLRISLLAAVFNCGTYIFDASNPLWKIAKWKKDCEDLHLRFHSVPEQGAFVTDL